MRGSEVMTSVVKWSTVGCSLAKCSEGLSSRMSNIIRRYIDHLKVAVYMASSFITFFLVLLVPFLIIVYMIIRFVCFCLTLKIMYFHCYVYVLSLLCMFCSVHSVFIVPAGTLRLPWPRFFCAFSSAVRQMPGCNSQRRSMVRTLPN